MHCRKQTKLLTRDQCKDLHSAWDQARRNGHPLNAFITIRPGNLTPLEHADLVAKFKNRLGTWSRRATKRAYGKSSFHYVLTREAAPNGKHQFGKGEHFHVLVHVPDGMFALLRGAVKRWHPGKHAAVIKPAHQVETWTEHGKIRSAIGYLTKQRTQQAWWKTPYSHKPGGIVLGKRYSISASLRAAARPIRIARFRTG